MSEAKFTPGPWEVSVGNSGSIFGDLDNEAHNGDHPYIGTVAGIGEDKDIPECTANAKLIAAAPELITVLSKWVDDYEAYRRNEPTDTKAIEAIYKEAKAAIDKATL